MKKILVGLISASLCFSIMQPVMAFENTNLIQAKKNTQKNIVDGIYNIQEDGQCLEIEGDNIAFRNPLEKAKTQKWVFAQADDGEFAIISLGTGYCFGISGKKDLDNAEISFSPYRGKSAQGWNLKKEKNGEFSIRSVLDPTYVLSFDEGASPSLVKEDTETPTYTISYVRD
ncbi:MAG: RICIN domain-containing protein, partial [Firmicutes bacterium]|nr:RICIN domain-containing protein [Bacillota bacterium]